jgi:aspartate/methionine/tyrosine aminotransferase
MAMSDLLHGADEDLRDRWDGLRLGYTESQGLPELRAEVASMYETVAPDEVLVAAPEEAIFLAMNSLLSAGDHVVCTFPGYQSLYQLARSIGCEVSFWEPVEGDTWRFDPADLEGLLRPETKLVVWNFPHNPTGAVPSQADYERMIGAVKSAGQGGAWLFSDEMYRLLEPDPAARLPAACELYERGISLAGLSKAHGLPGLRIGWLATRAPEVLERCLAMKDYTTICSGAPGEVLAVVALEAQEVLLRRSLATVRANLAVAEAFFAEHRGQVEWLPPRAGSVAFPRWLGAGPVEALCQRALDEERLMIVPGSLFQHPGSHFRVGLGRAGFPQALERLGRVLGRSSG